MLVGLGLEIWTRKKRLEYSNLLKRSHWGQKKGWGTLKRVRLNGINVQIKNCLMQNPRIKSWRTDNGFGAYPYVQLETNKWIWIKNQSNWRKIFLPDKIKRADEEKHRRWHSYGPSQQKWNNGWISIKAKTRDGRSRMRS